MTPREPSRPRPGCRPWRRMRVASRRVLIPQTLNHSLRLRLGGGYLGSTLATRTRTVSFSYTSTVSTRCCIIFPSGQYHSTLMPSIFSPTQTWCAISTPTWCATTSCTCPTLRRGYGWHPTVTVRVDPTLPKPLLPKEGRPRHQRW